MGMSQYLRAGVCLTAALVGVVGAMPRAYADAQPWPWVKGEESFTAARTWNEELLFAIRRDTARPVVHARNLFHTSVAMWDAWAAYDATAVGYLVREKVTPPGTAEDLLAARSETISFACYRVLVNRFTNSPGAVTSLAEFASKMAELGYDKDNTSTEGDSPAALGNRIGAAVIAWGLTDNSNQQNNYAANNGYTPVNPPLVVKLYGNPDMVDPNRWQPLALDFFIDQGGIVLGPYPAFIGPHWGGVTPFCLRTGDRSDETGLYLDPGVFPQFGSERHDEFVDAFVRNIELSSWLTPDDGVMIDISPASLGNNPLGTNDGTGYEVNPITGLPYEPQLVKRGDWARVISEFWADGPSSETPPGHWNTLANYVTDNLAEKRIGGVGPIIDDLEWDVKMYLALNGGAHDAAIVAWGIKGYYDGVRPISAIRYLCELGQSSDPDAPNYDPLGMPLIPGLIELITEETTAPGERHAELAGEEGNIAVLSWPGAPANPATEYSGVKWMLCGDWLPYQRPTFVSPPFAGYVSGHSTYSRTAAEVLTLLTGSAYFPGGLGTYDAPQNAYLVFEDGPSQDVQMQWATYYDAADQSGISRITGGIHPPIDDFPGRRLGAQIGPKAFVEAAQYWNGTALYHTADTDQDNKIGLDELLRAIQFYNIGGYDCAAATEDGFEPGEPGAIVAGTCYPHDGDYSPADFSLNLTELLRMIQFFNVGEYSYCENKNPATEDNFCCPSEV